MQALDTATITSRRTGSNFTMQLVKRVSQGISRRALRAGLVLTLAPSLGAAQELRPGVAYLHSSNTLIRGALGPDVALSIALPAKAALVFGAGGIRHTFRGNARTCAGLTPPGTDCSAEPTHQRATLAFARAGVELPVARWNGGTLAVGPEFLIGYESSSIRGDRSGRTLDADARRRAFGGSATLRHQLRAPRPIQLVVGGGVAVGAHVDPQVLVDGYTPLNDDDTVYRVAVGIAIGLGRGRGGS